MFGRTRRRRWLQASIALFVVIVALIGYGYAETYRIEVKEYMHADSDLPSAFDGTRIALITDIHRGPFFSQDRVRSLVERVNSLQPDLILLGGDYVFLGTDYAASCFEELAGLEAPLGRFAVLGNHDYGEYKGGEKGPALVIGAMQAAGITLLRDRGEWIEEQGERIWVAGVSDYSVDEPSLELALHGAGEGDFVILVSHNPDYAEELPGGAVNLMLAGHTHGGQVTLFGLWAPHLPSDYGQKYRTGLVETEVTTVIVSNGIGTSTIPPVRLLARPQIVVITLQSGPAVEPSACAELQL